MTDAISSAGSSALTEEDSTGVRRLLMLLKVQSSTPPHAALLLSSTYCCAFMSKSIPIAARGLTSCRAGTSTSKDSNTLSPWASTSHTNLC